MGEIAGSLGVPDEIAGSHHRLGLREQEGIVCGGLLGTETDRTQIGRAPLVVAGFVISRG
ncbi:hypothetical protein [Streptomyces venezuelae]|uniref:hypothetical protein n=1 Tax=Streptomyces venezuelae TaxID=54571 RepID=UPI00123C6DE4|nr:hypothetical protein [Streptomyces venezuelae]